MKIFYFTGTGNSLQIARGIGADGELVSIPRFLREQSEDTAGRIHISADAIGLVFPTYWLTVPTVVVEFLERTHLDTDYLFAITTRGNTSLTLKSELLSVVRKNGRHLSYFNKVNMPDNYIPMFDMVKTKASYNEDAISKSIERMASDIRSRKKNVALPVGLALLRPLARHYSVASMKDFSSRFYVNDSCTSCGICSLVCSAQSIAFADVTPSFGKSCNYCLACAHNCAANAIHMKPEKNSERYLNPTVSTADIIAANSGTKGTV